MQPPYFLGAAAKEIRRLHWRLMNMVMVARGGDNIYLEQNIWL